MTPKIVHVEPREPARLQVVFADGEVRLFDVSPYLDKGVFRELAEAGYFRQVRAAARYVYWPNEQDLSADTLYLRGVPVDTTSLHFEADEEDEGDQNGQVRGGALAGKRADAAPRKRGHSIRSPGREDPARR